jgi:hypothetical protein
MERLAAGGQYFWLCTTFLIIIKSLMNLKAQIPLLEEYLYSIPGDAEML